MNFLYKINKYFVYKGINTYLHVNIGDIIENKGYLHTYLSKTYAKKIMTTECYEKGDLTFKKSILKKHGESTLFKIYIPFETHHITKNIKFNDPYPRKTEKLIFDKGYDLSVIYVSNDPYHQKLELLMLF